MSVRYFRLTLVARLDRYAAAATVPRGQTTQSRTLSSSTIFLPRTDIPSLSPGPSFNTTTEDGCSPLQFGKPTRSSTMITVPSQTNSQYWAEVGPSPPRIFPGVVQERSRRGSIRQANVAERANDPTIARVGGALSPAPSEQDGNTVHTTTSIVSDSE